MAHPPHAVAERLWQGLTRLETGGWRLETGWRLGILVVTLILSGCVVSPVPQPPPLTLDVTTITAGVCPMCDQNAITLEGPPGSVTGEDPVIWIVNLDSTRPPETHPVAADGSFEAEIEGGAGATLRIQVRSGETRTDPVDLTFDEEEQITVVEHPLGGCFSIEPRFELDFEAAEPGSRRQVQLVNDCGGELSFEPLRLRTAHEGLAVEGELATLDVGEEATVTVEYTTTAPAGLIEEILFIEVIVPEQERRAITLIAGSIEN